MSPPSRIVELIVPEGFDDPLRASGGNQYDRRLAAGLADLGWQVRPHPVPGHWPWPDAAALDRLTRVLSGMADGSLVLVDGLIGSTLPDVFVPAARRLRLVVLVLMPLGDSPMGHEVDDAAARERAVLEAAAAVVTVSAWTRDDVLARYALPPDRVQVALPGTERAELAEPTASGNRLLCVAAVSQHKGHDVLIDSLDRIAELDWDCTCVGSLDREPDFVEQLRRRRDRGRLRGRLHLTGPRAGDELADSYAAADLVVLATRVESYGMVLTEALARGIPVVASAVGGVPEAVGTSSDGHRPGLLVPPGDPAALADRLARWLTDAHLRHGLRQAARDRRSSLPSWESTAQRVDAVLRGISRRSVY
jgi:glycosyltransferase involved in cell wall biosynthesis